MATLLSFLQSRTVTAGDGCLLWTGVFDKNGYPRARFCKREFYVHRVVYELAHGPIPEGMTIDHICWTPACVNPDHLQALSNRDNAARQRSAFSVVCKGGHPFSGDNLYVLPSGKRACRECNRRAAQRYVARKRAALASATDSKAGQS